jgi:hypothetical protein
MSRNSRERVRLAIDAEAVRLVEYFFVPAFSQPQEADRPMVWSVFMLSGVARVGAPDNLLHAIYGHFIHPRDAIGVQPGAVDQDVQPPESLLGMGVWATLNPDTFAVVENFSKPGDPVPGFLIGFAGVVIILIGRIGAWWSTG